ncbi:MAG: MFS transporter [Candidatus Methanofastidiosia archaeon]|jgi:MFS family permease
MKRRILGVFSGYSFLVEMRRGIMVAFFSIYLAEEMGASLTKVGVMWTIVYLVNALFQIVWGHVSDRVAKRKHFLILGEGAPGIAFFFIPEITSFYTLAIFMAILQVFWSASGPIWRALIAEHSVPGKRAGTMGKITTWGGIGSIIGIYIASDLIEIYGYAYLFYFSGLCMLAAAGVAALASEPKGLKPSSKKLISVNQMKTLANEQRHFTMYTVLTLLFFFTVYLTENFVNLYLRQLGASVQQVGYIFMVRDGTATALMIPMGKLSDRLGRVKMLQISLGINALILLGFGLAPVWWWIFPIVVLEGIGWSGYFVSSFAVLSSLTPKEQRGTYMGFHSTVLMLSNVAPSVGGPVGDRLGLKMLFLSSFGLCGAVVFYFAGWLRENYNAIHESEN